MQVPEYQSRGLVPAITGIHQRKLKKVQRNQEILHDYDRADEEY